MRSRLGANESIKSSSMIVAIVVASTLSVSSLSAQETVPCGVSGSVGVVLPSSEASIEEPLMSEERTTFEQLASGLALSLQAECPLAGPWRLGVVSERLDLEDVVFYHFSASLGIQKTMADRANLSARARLGWRHATDVILGPGGAGDFHDDLVLGDDGPLVGADLRVGYQVGEVVELFVDAGWRVGWLQRRIVNFEEETRDAGTEWVHVFPFTGGLTVRL